jgi:hypothetical protein
MKIMADIIPFYLLLRIHAGWQLPAVSSREIAIGLRGFPVRSNGPHSLFPLQRVRSGPPPAANQYLRQFNLLRKGLAPYFIPLFRVGHGKVNNSLESPGKGIVYIAALIGGRYHQPVVAFDPLQQIGDFLIGIFVMGITNVGSFTENCIGLIKE